MVTEEILGILQFLRDAEQLKNVYRTAWTSGGQPESTAAHTWRLCLSALVFAGEFPDINVERLLKLCIIHDLGEAIGGDIPAIHQDASAPKAEQERADLVTLLEPLPSTLQDEILGLWDEYEAAATPEAKLAKALDKWEGGRLVVNVVEMPIKCPVAPLEFVFLADWFFTKKGIRNKVEIALVTPLDGAFTKPQATKALSHLLEKKNIQLVTEFSTGQVDGETGRLISWDEREEPFDLLVSIPAHTGADFVANSPGLGDDMRFVLTDPNTLQAKVKDNVFALGDATNLPTSKAGSVAHFESEILTENIAAFLAGKPLAERFDGHANCFIETGFNKALLIDFNYELEPLPGKFPVPALGPMALLKESKLNHLGKMAFHWIYWNMLLPGRDLPLVKAGLSLAGKKVPQELREKLTTAA